MRTLANTTLVVALLVLIQGCDITNVVERTEPSTSVSQSTALSTEDGINGIRAQMYGRFHSEDMSTDWLLGPSALADDTYFRASQGRHQGLNLNQLRAGIGTGSWGNLYNTINDANILINGIEEGVISEAKAKKFEAEARFIRALCYHHLVRIFGYAPAEGGGVLSPASGPGAGFNLGVPLRTQPTLTTEDAAPKNRSTVPEVYSQIVTDLDSSIILFQNLPGDVKESAPFYPTEAAAHALLARVQLYNKNYDAANQQAQIALDQAPTGLATTVSQLDAIFDETASAQEAIFTIDTDPNTESAGVNNAISAYTSREWMAQIPTEELINAYPSGDKRLQAWYGQCFDEIAGSYPSGCENINRDSLELQKYNAEQGSYADDYVHLRVGELKLIQAEARLQGASGNPAAPLNDLRTARGLSAVSQSAVDMGLILEERRRELVAEGHRFYDFKRLGMDISKSVGKLNDPGDDQSSLSFESFRLLDDIPSSQVEVEGLTQNPGYR
ncbi:MAG: RagB/SusD family nutrient uptake outer membrane protein [Salinibacter sp.]